MAWTAADLVAIDAAIASGVLRVSYKDRDVTYRSMEELLLAKAQIQGSIASDAGTRVRQFRFVTDKGL